MALGEIRTCQNRNFSLGPHKITFLLALVAASTSTGSVAATGSLRTGKNGLRSLEDVLAKMDELENEVLFALLIKIDNLENQVSKLQHRSQMVEACRFIMSVDGVCQLSDPLLFMDDLTISGMGTINATLMYWVLRPSKILPCLRVM